MTDYSTHLSELRERLKIDGVHLCYQQLLSAKIIQQLVALVKVGPTIASANNGSNSKPLLKAIWKSLFSSFNEDMLVSLFECLLIPLRNRDDENGIDDEIASLVLLILLFRTVKRNKVVRAFMRNASSSPKLSAVHLLICFDAIHSVLNESPSASHASSPYLGQLAYSDFVELLGKKEILQLLRLPHARIGKLCLQQYCLTLNIIQQFFTLPHFASHGLNLVDCEQFWVAPSRDSSLQQHSSMSGFIESRVLNMLKSHPLVCYLYRSTTPDFLASHSISAPNLLVTQRLVLDSAGPNISDANGEQDLDEMQEESPAMMELDIFAIYHLLLKLNSNPAPICMLCTFFLSWAFIHI
jgi:hypothetical protein